MVLCDISIINDQKVIYYKYYIIIVITYHSYNGSVWQKYYKWSKISKGTWTTWSAVKSPTAGSRADRHPEIHFYHGDRIEVESKCYHSCNHRLTAWCDDNRMWRAKVFRWPTGCMERRASTSLYRRSTSTLMFLLCSTYPLFQCWRNVTRSNAVK